MIKSVINLLLVEDNQNDVVLFRTALKKADLPAVKLQSVWDGTEAVAYLKGEGKYHDRTAHPVPDLVLLDINMPRMNGIEVLEWIRHDATYKHLMVHVLTSSLRSEDVAQAYDRWVNSYVVKPASVHDLIRFIQGLITLQEFVCLPTLPAKQGGHLAVDPTHQPRPFLT